MHIGFSFPDPTSTFWTLISYGVRSAASELGAKLTALPAQTYQEQINAIAQLVAQQVDVLIIGPFEPQFLAPVIDAVTQGGIPVLTVGVHIPGSAAIGAVYPDNVAAAASAATYIVERLAGSGKVLHLRGPASAAESVDRARGIQQVMEQHPAMQVIYSDHGDWSEQCSAPLMTVALAEHPDIDAVFAANDPMALGALDAIAAAGRSDQICVVGFDGLPEALLAIRAGTMAATVRQSIAESGRSVVRLAASVAAGAPIPPVVYTETQLITAANVTDAMATALAIMPLVLQDAVENSARLSRERRILRTVLDAVPETHIFIKDQQGRFILTNRAHLSSLGVSDMQEVIGKTDRDLFSHELAAQYEVDEQAVISSGEGLHNRVEPIIDSAGNHKWYLTSKVPLQGDDGNNIGLIGISRDITVFKTLEDERQRLQGEIIRAQEGALRELSAPLMPIDDRIMVMPLVGSIDLQRAVLIFDSLLSSVAEHQAHTVIIDITGVTIGDTHVADTLIRAAQTIKLLGAQTIITGIRPEIAQNFVSLGMSLESLITRSTLQSGIDYALRRTGAPRT